jgi:hypothetical protein
LTAFGLSNPPQLAFYPVVRGFFYWTDEMKKDLTASPTEYRGTVYRSKCEAMFARWLDLRNSDDAVVMYEPDWAEIGDYVPDFAVIRPVADGERIPRFLTCVELIEYKPSRPTLSYVKKTMQKLQKIAERELPKSEVDEIQICVYFGSVYTEDRGVFHVSGTGGFTHNSINWLSVHEKAVRDFRFDLEADPCL